MQESLGGSGTESDDHLRLDDIDFRLKKGEEGGHFVGRWFPIVGGLVFGSGTEFANVCEVDVLSGESHRFEDLVEFFASRANERFLFLFLLETRGFANKNEGGLRVTGGKNHCFAETLQGASGGPVFGLGGEGGDFFGVGASGWVENSALWSLGGGGGCGERSPRTAASVEFAEDIARGLFDGNVGDAIALELVKVVEQGGVGHGRRKAHGRGFGESLGGD